MGLFDKIFEKKNKMEDSSTTTKKCPNCGMVIKKKALRCKHCNYYFKEGKVMPKTSTINKSNPAPSRSLDDETNIKKNTKRDNAQKFKDAYETGSLGDVFSALRNWQSTDGKNDANCSFAVVIVTQFDSFVDMNNAKNLYLAAKRQNCKNKELQSWFESTAQAVSKMKGITI